MTEPWFTTVVPAAMRMLVELAAVGVMPEGDQFAPLSPDSSQVEASCQRPEAALRKEVPLELTTVNVATEDVTDEESQATLTMQRNWLPLSARVVAAVV